MNTLTAYAELAEVFGALAIIGSALFGVVQVNQYRRRIRCKITADLCRTFTEPSLANAVVLLSALPDGLSLEELKKRDNCYQEAAQIVGMTFETMGLLVQKDIASLQIVQELTGGLLLMQWRKIEFFIKDTRREQGNPRFGEWVEWLVDRIEEREAGKLPAFELYSDSKKYWKLRY